MTWPAVFCKCLLMKIIERPVLIGAGQFTQQKKAFPALDPVGLMAVASQSALADAGVDTALLDTICIINMFSWAYDDPCGTAGGSSREENLWSHRGKYAANDGE